MDSLRGKLILAGPMLKDPNFDRTVVLITEHTDEGAMGLVLNRPSSAASPTPCRTSRGSRRRRQRVRRRPGRAQRRDRARRVGRPGGGRRARRRRPRLRARRHRGSDAIGAAIRRARVYAGHAGWGPGQLEAELAEEAWIVETPLREELFSADAGAPLAVGAAAHGARVRAPVDDAAGPLAQLTARAFTPAPPACDIRPTASTGGRGRRSRGGHGWPLLLACALALALALLVLPAPASADVGDESSSPATAASPGPSASTPASRRSARSRSTAWRS